LSILGQMPPILTLEDSSGAAPSPSAQSELAFEEKLRDYMN
jgi:hypothetical protein